MSEGFGVSAWGTSTSIKLLGLSGQQQILHGLGLFLFSSSKIQNFGVPN